MNSLLFSKLKIRAKSTLILLFLGLFFSDFTNIYSQDKDFIVVLDAGHGGKDPGKVGYKKVKEKDIALNIVKEVGKILGKEKNIKIVFTRKTDVFIGLKERGQIANKANADLFVSVHCNAHNTQAYGSETWVLGTHANKKNFEVAKAENSVILLEDNYKMNYKGFDPHSPESVIGLTLMQEEYLDQSILLSSIIQEDFTSKLKRKDRGVKQAGFVVLHQTYMPSVLIETGFITNKTEGTYLGSLKGQGKFAKSIAESIMKYYRQLVLNTVDAEIASNNNKPETVKTNVYKDVTFKVQIASGRRKLETKSYNFKGLRNVERVKVQGSYKYYLGKTSDFSEIKKVQQKAKSKGYASAFIVAFENGKKVSVDAVLEKS